MLDVEGRTPDRHDATRILLQQFVEIIGRGLWLGTYPDDEGPALLVVSAQRKRNRKASYSFVPLYRLPSDDIVRGVLFFEI